MAANPTRFDGQLRVRKFAFKISNVRIYERDKLWKKTLKVWWPNQYVTFDIHLGHVCGALVHDLIDATEWVQIGSLVMGMGK